MGIRPRLRGLVILVVTTQAFAFLPSIHQHITTISLGSISKQINGKTLKFTHDAITEISNANKAVDCGGQAFCFCVSCLTSTSAHFDDEDFAGGSDRLVQLRQKIIAEITLPSPNGAMARQDLGMALHTLQDFYSHTNRVEANLSKYDSLLGQKAFTVLGPVPNFPTCPNDSSTLGGYGLNNLTSGYFDSPYCLAPAHDKCKHGLKGFCTGINQDYPGQTYYNQAFGLATQMTISFVNSILNASAVTNNEKAVRALMGIKSTLGFVIDTTGSMGDIIGQVQAAVVQTVNSVAGTTDEPDQYLLEPFNDPNWGPPYTTADASEFIAAVNALTASGGGDCPELPLHGMLDAISASYPDSQLYLYTDASSKDGYLEDNVVAAARSKNISGNFLNFGSCSPIDPSYSYVAYQTGGQALFLPRNQAGATFALIKPQLGVIPATIVNAQGTLDASPESFEIPVDNTITNITFVITADTLTDVALMRPTGDVVKSTDPGVTFTSLSTSKVFTIAMPQVGSWSVKFNGSGAFGISVQGSTSIDQVDNIIRLNQFSFVTLTGRPAHDGYFSTPGEPVFGETPTGLAIMQGTFSKVSFELVSQAGLTLQSVTLAPDDPNAASGEFVGSFQLPAQPFRLQASGTDSAGHAFRRVFPQLFSGESVLVTTSNTIDTLPSAQSTSLAYSVTNSGPAGTFSITAMDNRGFVNGVNPAQVTLATGESKMFDITLTVAAGTPSGTAMELTTVVTDITDPAIKNTAVQFLTVGGSAEADLAIGMTGSQSSVPAGSSLSYTLNVTNKGPGSALNTVVTDKLPAGITFASAPSFCSVANSTLSCNIGTVTSVGSTSFTVNLSIPADYLSNNYLSSSTITNSASVSSTVADPNPSDNSASVSTNIISVSGLVLNVTAQPNPIAAGGLLTYLFHFVNEGPSDAIQGFILDYNPLGTQFVGSSTLPCGSGVGVVLCNLGPIIPAGFGLTFSMQVKVSSSIVPAGRTSANIVNQAEIMSDSVDPNAGSPPVLTNTAVVP
jgi:uncharacterized repeat protein (TIGR01451 family)